MNKRAFGVSEAAGCAAIYAAAVYLHFAYRLSGGSALGLIFGAVNESVWEHVKIFSAAYSGYALIQLSWIKVPFRKYVAAKCAGLYALMGGIIIFYYTYTYFTGADRMWLDITGAAVLVMIAQIISYTGTTGENHRIGELFAPALMLLMLYYLMFFSFTVFPPKTELFRDPVSGAYGIGAETCLLN